MGGLEVGSTNLGPNAVINDVEIAAGGFERCIRAAKTVHTSLRRESAPGVGWESYSASAY